MRRVTINGSVAQFSYKRTNPKELWDVKEAITRKRGDYKKLKRLHKPDGQRIFAFNI